MYKYYIKDTEKIAIGFFLFTLNVLFYKQRNDLKCLTIIFNLWKLLIYINYD